MNICSCYHDEQNFLHERGVCYGTKEKEPCSCGGNPVKCDFYEGVREKYIYRTNADRIRAMNDEELADKFEEIQLKTANAYGDDDLLLKGELKKYWLDWLKKEVSE